MTTKHTRLTKNAFEIFFVVLVCFVNLVPIAVGRESGEMVTYDP